MLGYRVEFESGRDIPMLPGAAPAELVIPIHV